VEKAEAYLKHKNRCRKNLKLDIKTEIELLDTFFGKDEEEEEEEEK
jgi:hypothetical protein